MQINEHIYAHFYMYEALVRFRNNKIIWLSYTGDEILPNSLISLCIQAAFRFGTINLFNKFLEATVRRLSLLRFAVINLYHRTCSEFMRRLDFNRGISRINHQCVVAELGS